MVITARIPNSCLDKATNIMLSIYGGSRIGSPSIPHPISLVTPVSSSRTIDHRLNHPITRPLRFLLTLYSGVVAGILIPLACQSISRRRNCARFSNTIHLPWNLKLRSISVSDYSFIANLNLFVKFDHIRRRFTKSFVLHYLQRVQFHVHSYPI